MKKPISDAQWKILSSMESGSLCFITGLHAHYFHPSDVMKNINSSAVYCLERLGLVTRIKEGDYNEHRMVISSLGKTFLKQNRKRYE